MYKELREVYKKSKSWLYHEDLKELYAELKLKILNLPKDQFTEMIRYLRKR